MARSTALQQSAALAVLLSQGKTPCHKQVDLPEGVMQHTGCGTTARYMHCQHAAQ